MIVKEYNHAGPSGDYFARYIEHMGIVLKGLSARLAARNRPKPKRPEPTPFEGSWAHQMQLIREGKMEFTPPPSPQDHWVTLGPCDSQGRLITKI